MSDSLLVNGMAPADPRFAIGAADRGFQYGDGVFETALVAHGRVRFFDDHWQRLALGCRQLDIPLPDRSVLMQEIAAVIGAANDGVLKITVTRGAGERGYRPAAAPQPTRVVALHPAPGPGAKRPLALRWCETRLARNARLAGIKHLNRLEQVLAQAEWRDADIDEGLMLDTEGELVCGTASNVFTVRDGRLATPDLRFCGVRGVMRAQVLRSAATLGVAVAEEPLWPHDLDAASEVFITNAVHGIRPVARLGTLRWQGGSLTQRLIKALEP